MPVLALVTSTMDTERILKSHTQDGSPGSGSGQSQQELMVSSLARRKKSEGYYPPSSRGLLDQPQPQQHGNQMDPQLHSQQQSNHLHGVSNPAYTRHNQTGSSLGGARLNTTCETTVSIPGEDSNEEQEVIEVKILPQDDDWGETTTAVTNISDLDHAGMNEYMEKWQVHEDKSFSCRCSRYIGPIISGILAFAAFLSPIIMVALPQFDVFEMREKQLECDVTCDGMLISFSFKLLILLIGTWAVFFRRPKSSLPRIFVFRALVSLLVFVFVLSFWLFYAVHLLEERNRIKYSDIVQFSLYLTDTLLFVHYLAIVLIELRHLSPVYYVKVLRSPDGLSTSFCLGELSIQRAASEVLQRYYVEFPIYNPYLDFLPGSRREKKAKHKIYDVDSVSTNGNMNDCNSTVVSATSKRGTAGHSSHNDHYYEEQNYERKVQKRRARLIKAAEDSFTNIKRMHQGGSKKQPLSSYEAAQAVFPSLSRTLQKYLRVTRQQPRHTMESILQHLSVCLSFGMSPRAFLEKYLVTSPVLQNDRELTSGEQGWSLVCDSLLTRSIGPGTVFQLRQGEVSLLCSVSRLPHLSMQEEIIDPNSNKFVLRMSSETSV